MTKKPSDFHEKPTLQTASPDKPFLRRFCGHLFSASLASEALSLLFFRAVGYSIGLR
jgi:hypothetical protein